MKFLNKKNVFCPFEKTDFCLKENFLHFPEKLIFHIQRKKILIFFKKNCYAYLKKTSFLNENNFYNYWNKQRSFCS